ncbi:MAG: hypothetical protein AB9891_06910 [Anaerolineaceae bacterium]
MTISEFDQLVLDAESEVQAIQARAEKMVCDLKDTMPNHLEEMANQVVLNTIDGNPNAIIALGDKAKDLKKQIANVTATFPDEVNTKLDSNVKWAHKQYIGQEKNDYRLKDTLVKQTSSSIHDVGRLILGKIGVLLIEHGLAKISKDSYWKTERGNSIMFSYGLGFYHFSQTSEFQKTEQRYISIIDEYVTALKNLDVARENKNKAEAKKFWDEA